MRERHPYDKSLGEKMSSLPVPDVKKSWEEMRMLLDREMPPGRSKRRGGWWFPGALLIMLVTATSILITINLSPQHGDPPLSAGGPGDNPALANNHNLSEKPDEPNDKILLNEQQIKPSASSKTDGGTSAGNNNLPDSYHRDNGVFKTGQTGDDLLTRLPGKRGGTGNISSGSLSDEAAKRVTEKPTVAGLNESYKPGAKKPPTGVTGDAARQQAAIADAMEAERELDHSSVGSPVRFTAAGVSVLFDSVDRDKPLAAQYAPVSRKYYRQHRKHRPPNIRQPYTTAGRVFAFGVSLPLAFPLGDQKMLGYNISAGPNTVSDYIPAPHVQYHFNSKSYVQTEIQVMSPQYIRPVMLHHHEYQTSVSRISSSVYARKLYYFNVPVSIHYSPFKHFYLGTGLQFSSLLGGVAEHEKIRSGMVSSDSLYQSDYARFGNDSIGSRLRRNEIRLLLDANYYWNRFTVGLRYNQAFNNYVSLRPSSTAAYTLDKNKALQFYMRFNLWEEKKRKPVQHRVLTYR